MYCERANSWGEILRVEDLIRWLSEFDDAMSGLHSRSAMTRENRMIVRMLAKVRAKNLFMVLVSPSYFDLDKNVAIHRINALEYNGDSYYDKNRKKQMYVTGKKFYSYSVKEKIVGVKY